VIINAPCHLKLSTSKSFCSYPKDGYGLKKKSDASGKEKKIVVDVNVLHEAYQFLLKELHLTPRIAKKKVFLLVLFVLQGLTWLFTVSIYCHLILISQSKTSFLTFKLSDLTLGDKIKTFVFLISFIMTKWLSIYFIILYTQGMHEGEDI